METATTKQRLILPAVRMVIPITSRGPPTAQHAIEPHTSAHQSNAPPINHESITPTLESNSQLEPKKLKEQAVVESTNATPEATNASSLAPEEGDKENTPPKGKHILLVYSGYDKTFSSVKDAYQQVSDDDVVYFSRQMIPKEKTGTHRFPYDSVLEFLEKRKDGSDFLNIDVIYETNPTPSYTMTDILLLDSMKNIDYVVSGDSKRIPDVLADEKVKAVVQKHVMAFSFCLTSMTILATRLQSLIDSAVDIIVNGVQNLDRIEDHKKQVDKFRSEVLQLHSFVTAHYIEVFCPGGSNCSFKNIFESKKLNDLLTWLEVVNGVAVVYNKFDQNMLCLVADKDHGNKVLLSQAAYNVFKHQVSNSATHPDLLKAFQVMGKDTSAYDVLSKTDDIAKAYNDVYQKQPNDDYALLLTCLINKWDVASDTATNVKAAKYALENKFANNGFTYFIDPTLFNIEELKRLQKRLYYYRLLKYKADKDSSVMDFWLFVKQNPNSPSSTSNKGGGKFWKGTTNNKGTQQEYKDTEKEILSRYSEQVKEKLKAKPEYFEILNLIDKYDENQTENAHFEEKYQQQVENIIKANEDLYDKIVNWKSTLALKKLSTKNFYNRKWDYIVPDVPYIDIAAHDTKKSGKNDKFEVDLLKEWNDYNKTPQKYCEIAVAKLVKGFDIKNVLETPLFRLTKGLLKHYEATPKSGGKLMSVLINLNAQLDKLSQAYKTTQVEVQSDVVKRYLEENPFLYILYNDPEAKVDATKYVKRMIKFVMPKSKAFEDVYSRIDNIIQGEILNQPKIKEEIDEIDRMRLETSTKTIKTEILDAATSSTKYNELIEKDKKEVIQYIKEFMSSPEIQPYTTLLRIVGKSTDLKRLSKKYKNANVQSEDQPNAQTGGTKPTAVEKVFWGNAYPLKASMDKLIDEKHPITQLTEPVITSNTLDKIYQELTSTDSNLRGIVGTKASNIHDILLQEGASKHIMQDLNTIAAANNIDEEYRSILQQLPDQMQGFTKGNFTVPGDTYAYRREGMLDEKSKIGRMKQGMTNMLNKFRKKGDKSDAPTTNLKTSEDATPVPDSATTTPQVPTYQMVAPPVQQPYTQPPVPNSTTTTPTYQMVAPPAQQPYTQPSAYGYQPSSVISPTPVVSTPTRMSVTDKTYVSTPPSATFEDENDPTRTAVEKASKLNLLKKDVSEKTMYEHLQAIEDFVTYMDEKSKKWTEDIASVKKREFDEMVKIELGNIKSVDDIQKKQSRAKAKRFYNKFIKLVRSRSDSFYAFVKNFYTKDSRKRVKQIVQYLKEYSKLTDPVFRDRFKPANYDEMKRKNLVSEDMLRYERLVAEYEKYQKIEGKFKTINEKFDIVNNTYYETLTNVVDSVFSGGNLSDLDDDVRVALTSATENVVNSINKYKMKIKSYYRLNYSMADLLFDTQFLILYIIKAIRIGFTYLALFMATKVFSPMYEQQVYDQKTNPPSLIKYLLIFVGFDLSFNVFLVVVLFLLKFMFKTDDNAFVIDKYLFYKYLVDYAMSLILLLAIASLVQVVITNKKYFKYKYEGLRAIRAFEEIIFYMSIVIYIFPYFWVL